MPQATLLSINGIDFSDYAVRGITMTLKPVQNGELARDCNGDLVDLTLESHRKYAFSIECKDHEAPDLNGVWRGSQITVACIPHLGVENSTDGVLTLVALVDDWQVAREEYEADSAWSLSAIEV